MDITQALVASLAHASLDLSSGGNGSGNGNGGNDSVLLATGETGPEQHNASADGGMVPYVPVLDRPETYIVTVLYTLIFIVGVLGNGTLVIIFFRHRSMRNIPNT